MQLRPTAITRPALAVVGGIVFARPGFGSELASRLQGEGASSLRQWVLGIARAVGDPPVAYWAVGLFLLAVLSIVSLLPLLLRPAVPSAAAKVILDRRLYGFLVILTITALRWPVLSRTLLNTDEAHSIACAMKLAVDPVFWRGIDGTTGGPLLYYPLLLPRLLGLPMEYAAARLVGFGALIGSVLLLYGLVRRLADEGVARVAVLPLVVCWGLTTSSHFAHYSSEQIPVFLVTLALYLLVRWWTDGDGSSRSLVASGVVLGSLPLAKLQAVPIGLYLAVCGLAMIAVRYRGSPENGRRVALVFVGSGYVVPGLFVLATLLTGVFRDSWQSYLVNNLGYGGRYQQLGEATLPQHEKVWTVLDRMFWTFDLAEMVGPLTLFSALVLFGALLFDRPRLRQRLGWIALAVGFLLVSVVSVAFPNTLFTHYFLFLAVPVALLGAVSLVVAGEIVQERFSGRVRVVVLGLVLVLFLGSTVGRTVHHRLRRPHPLFSSLASVPSVNGDAVSEVALAFARPGESLAVWGWQPWKYVETGLFPATRDTQTQWQILDTPQRPYYQERFAADLESSSPPVFIDTVGYEEDPSTPSRPVFWDRETQAHDVYPQIAGLIERHYRQVADLQASRIYVSKERLAELEEKIGVGLEGLDSSELVALVPRLARVELTQAGGSGATDR